MLIIEQVKGDISFLSKNIFGQCRGGLMLSCWLMRAFSGPCFLSMVQAYKGILRIFIKMSFGHL